MNRDQENSIEPILEDSSNDLLSLDHTSVIDLVILDLKSSSYVQDSSSELKFTTTERGGQCLLEKGFSYTTLRIRGNTVHWQCVQRGVSNARIHTQDQIIVKRINEHSHEGNSAIFHCSKAGVFNLGVATPKGVAKAF